MKANANSQFVSAELSYPGGDYAMLRARSAVKGAWERFLVVGDCASSATGGCAFKSIANGMYVTAEVAYGGGDNGMLRARSSSIGAWERFKLVGDCGTGPGCALRSLANSTYVTTELGYVGSDYAMLRARSALADVWEKYRFQ